MKNPKQRPGGGDDEKKNNGDEEENRVDPGDPNLGDDFTRAGEGKDPIEEEVK